MVSESSYRVPYADTDQMGVVYYANYLAYFERARTEMLREAGISYRELEGMGCILPVVEAHCNYHNSARYDDLLTFRSWVLELGRVRLKIGTEVCRKGELLASGYVVLGCIDCNHRISRLHPKLVEVCQKLMAEE